MTGSMCSYDSVSRRSSLEIVVASTLIPLAMVINSLRLTLVISHQCRQGFFVVSERLPTR